MKRNVYFEGELGEKFIPHLSMEFTKPAEIFRCLDANFSDYKQYLLQKHEEGVGFHIDIAGNELEDPAELLMEMKEGDMIVTPIPAGAKSGPMKIIAAVALTVVTAGAFAAGGAILAGAGATGATAAVGATFGSFAGFTGTLTAMSGTVFGQMAFGVVTNLALGGIQQMMAPDPSTDGDSEQSYLFNGAEQNTVAGDPIPILYGRLRVPGQPISFELSGATGQQSNAGWSAGGGSSNSGYGDISYTGTQYAARDV